VKNLKQNVNFCSSSLSHKRKWYDKYEPHETVKIGEAIGVGLGLSLDLVFKVVTRGLLRTFFPSLLVVVVIVIVLLFFFFFLSLFLLLPPPPPPPPPLSS
jgi:hypothetical protein